MEWILFFLGPIDEEKMIFELITQFKVNFLMTKISKITKTGLSLSENQSLHWNVLRISIWEELINGKISNFDLYASIFLNFWGPVVNFGVSYDDSVNWKMMIYGRSIKHFMARLIKKSWTDYNDFLLLLIQFIYRFVIHYTVVTRPRGLLL